MSDSKGEKKRRSAFKEGSHAEKAAHTIHDMYNGKVGSLRDYGYVPLKAIKAAKTKEDKKRLREERNNAFKKRGAAIAEFKKTLSGPQLAEYEKAQNVTKSVRGRRARKNQKANYDTGFVQELFRMFGTRRPPRNAKGQFTGSGKRPKSAGPSRS